MRCLISPDNSTFFASAFFADFLPSQANIIQFATAFASAFAVCRHELPGLHNHANLIPPRNSAHNFMMTLVLKNKPYLKTKKCQPLHTSNEKKRNLYQVDQEIFWTGDLSLSVLSMDFDTETYNII